jgi:putative MATE family efflux protein
MKDLTKGSIPKLIIAFAVPVMIGNVLQLMYNLVDTKIVSQVLGETSLAAVGSTNSLYNLIIGFLQGLTNGFAVIAAQYFGAGDERHLKKVVAHSLKYGILISLVLTVCVLAFLRPLLRLLNTPERILDEAYSYIFIVFFGMTILMLYNVCCALLRAIGDAVTPLCFLAFSVTLNIFGDYLFMAVWHMGVKGAAYSTVLAQLIAMAICFLYMYIKYPILRVRKSDFKTDWQLVGKLMATGCSMGFMSCLVSLGSLILQGAINTFGEDIIVAHSTARRLTEMFMMLFGVLGTTMATFCGQNLGAGRTDRIKKGIFISVLMGWCWCVLVVIASYTVAPLMIRVLISSDNKAVVDTASLYLRIDSLLYFVTAMITIIRNSMQGIGDRITPIVSSSIELIGKILVVIFLVPRLGYMGIILAEPIVWVFMVIPLLVQLARNPLLKADKITI